MMKFINIAIIAMTFILSGCQERQTTNRIYVFSQPGCIHCVNARNYMSLYYKDYDIKEMNIREGSNMEHMLRYARRYKIPQQDLGTPLIIMGNNYIMGWGSEQQKDFNRYAKDFKPKSDTKANL